MVAAVDHPHLDEVLAAHHRGVRMEALFAVDFPYDCSLALDYAIFARRALRPACVNLTSMS